MIHDAKLLLDLANPRTGKSTVTGLEYDDKDDIIPLIFHACMMLIYVLDWLLPSRVVVIRIILLLLMISSR